MSQQGSKTKTVSKGYGIKTPYKNDSNLLLREIRVSKFNYWTQEYDKITENEEVTNFVFVAAMLLLVKC